MKRRLLILMVLLTFLTIAFILFNALSDGAHAEGKRDAVVRIFVGSRSLRRQVLKVVAKTFHVMEYAFFSFCFTSSVILLGDCKARFERVLLCGTFLALGDELIQSLFSDRTSRLTDVFVDLAGIMIGYWVSVCLARLIQKRKLRRKKGT